MRTWLLLPMVCRLIAQPGVSPGSGVATLDGRVINAVTGEPVKAARVRIRPVAGGNRSTTVTDASGVFHFAGLEPGTYGLQTEHANFVRGLGRGRSTAFQATVDLAASEKRTGLVVPVAPYGSVEGRVIAESGESVDRCDVELLQSEYRQGQSHLVVQESGSSGSRGHFRVANVAPGAYRVRVRCQPNPIPFRPLLPEGADPAGPSLGFAPTLLPDPVTVQSGLTTGGVEIQVRDTMLYPLAGTVNLPPEAHSAAAVQFALFPDGSDASPPYAAVATPANPSFRIAAAVPGRYWLVAFAKAGDELFTARQSVIVAEDAPRVDVTLSAGTDLTGTVEIRSANRSVGRPVSGSLHPVDSAIFGTRDFTSDPDGSFVLRSVPPGLWRLRLPTPATDFYLQSISQGPADLTSSEIAVHGAPLRVVFRDGAGSIEGVVRERDGQPRQSERTIAIKPLFTPNFLNPEQLLTTAGIDGRFRIGGLPPGRYRLFILPGLDPEVALNPVLLHGIEALAEIVTVESEKTSTANGRPIPDESVTAALARL